MLYYNGIFYFQDKKNIFKKILYSYPNLFYLRCLSLMTVFWMTEMVSEQTLCRSFRRPTFLYFEALIVLGQCWRCKKK